MKQVGYQRGSSIIKLFMSVWYNANYAIIIMGLWLFNELNHLSSRFLLFLLRGSFEYWKRYETEKETTYMPMPMFALSLSINIYDNAKKMLEQKKYLF